MSWDKNLRILCPTFCFYWVTAQRKHVVTKTRGTRRQNRMPHFVCHTKFSWTSFPHGSICSWRSGWIRPEILFEIDENKEKTAEQKHELVTGFLSFILSGLFSMLVYPIFLCLLFRHFREVGFILKRFIEWIFDYLFFFNHCEAERVHEAPLREPTPIELSIAQIYFAINMQG